MKNYENEGKKSILQNNKKGIEKKKIDTVQWKMGSVIPSIYEGNIRSISIE